MPPARTTTMRQRRKRHSTHLRHSLPIATLAVAGFLNATVACAAVHYTGEATDRNGSVLYRESHWLYQDNHVDTRLVLYTCPDGKAFARKTVWDRPNAQAPDFQFDDARDGFSEGVRSADDKRYVFVRALANAPEQSAAFDTVGDAVADAGFDTFVRTHWDALAATSALAISFVVPSRLASLGFSVRRIGDERIDGREARRFRLVLARWYGGFLPHIDVVYDTATRNLLRYEGIGNIRGADTRNLDVRIDFPANARSDGTSDADIAAATATPLNGTCRLP